MKQTCPDCKTVVEIDEREYPANSQCEKVCPLCGATLTFDIPAAKPEIVVKEVTRDVDEEQNTKIARLEEELRELKKKHSGQDSTIPFSMPNDEVPKIGWNWGAFLLGWIWGLGNGIFWPLALFLVCWIPYVGVIASLAVNIILGIKGSEWSWVKKDWGSARRFNEAQHNWSVAGIITFVVPFVLFLIIGLSE